MKPGIPWSIKGVEPELREVAKSAARRSGMTLGEWLNSAINVQADGNAPSEDGTSAHSEPRSLISTHPIERAASKLENIAAQLSRLASRETEGSYRPLPSAEDQFQFAKVLGRVESSEKQTVEQFAAMNDRLANISRQITRAQPVRIEEAPGFMALEKAVRNIVEHLDVSDKRTRENMKSLQDRMGEMASRASGAASTHAPAFSQLENRLAELARKIEQPTQPAYSEQLRSQIEQLTGRIDTVRDNAEILANRAQTQAVQEAQGELRTIEARIVGLLNEAKQSIAHDQVGPAELQRFRQEIDKVNSRIDETSRGQASDRDVSALKVAIEQLSNKVAQNANAQPMADIDRKVFEISQKLEKAEAAARNMPALSDLERRFAELDQRLAQSLQAPSVQHTEALTQKLVEVDDRLARTEHQLGHLETIERAISQLYDTIEQNRKSTHDIAHDAASRMVAQVAGQTAAPASLAHAPEIMALESGLKAVREASAHADQRSQETLEAVHETLEHIVGKLAELETVAIGQRLVHATGPAYATSPEIAPIISNYVEPPAEPYVEAAIYQPSAFATEPDHPIEALQSTPLEMPDTASVFTQEPHAENFMDPIFTGTQNPFASTSEANLQTASASAETPEGGIGDFVAAARRMHQASQNATTHALAGVVPGKKQSTPKTRGFSLPFLRRRSDGKTVPAALTQTEPTPESVTAALKPANSNEGSKRRLILVGFLLLAIATFATTNMLGRIDKTDAPAIPTAVEQPAPIIADPVAPAAAQPRPAPQQPEPAALAKPMQQGDASSNSPPSDPILTGALPPSKTGLEAPVAEAASPSAKPFSVVIDAAVGPSKLRQAAEGGDVGAQFIIASHYLNGDTIPIDFAKAAYWYGKASASGLAPAQYRLATLYERGKGVDKNLAAALSWYERSGSLGNVKAMHNAAVLAAGNAAGTPDYTRAYKWFSLAASHGLKDSEFNLAVLIERGLGTKQDNTASLFWYMAAAAQDDTDAKAHVDSLSKSLSAATVEAVKAKFKAWVPEKAPEAANTVAANDAQWNPQAEQNSQIIPRNVNDQAKALLDKLGYRVGVADGALDAKTSNAIKLFQIKQGLTVTGQVTPDLLNLMQQKAG